MTAATPLLRQSESSNAFVLIFGVLAVAAVGAGGGLALGFGELDAFWVCLAVLASLAVLFDFRIGAVLLMVLLPIEASTLFPHSIFGLTGLNPVNLLLLATLVSYLVRARAPGSMRILPRQLLWLYIVPIALAGLVGSRHAQAFVPAR